MPGPDPDRRIIDGQLHLSRNAIFLQTRYTPDSQKRLYGARAENGHPAGERVGRAMYFEAESVLAFYARQQAGARDRLSTVVRDGDPDELVGITQAALLLGFAGPATIRSYLTRQPEYFPAPDETSPRQRWRRRTLWTFADQTRTGQPSRRATRPKQDSDKSPLG